MAVEYDLVIGGFTAIGIGALVAVGLVALVVYAAVTVPQAHVQEAM